MRGTWVVGAVACLVLLSPARAALLSISNSDFETGGVPDGAFSNNPGVTPTGWTLVTSGSATGVFFGYLNPLDNSYLNTTGLPGSPASMSGPNVFYFGSLSDQQGISQTLTSTFDNATSYTLTVALGTRLLNTVMADFQMSLYAGSTLVASRTLLAANYATPSAAGTFVDYSLNYVAGTQNLAAVQGQALKLVFLQSGTGAEVDIDNIRLDAVPEPANGLLALGAILPLGFWLVRRRGAHGLAKQVS